MKEDNTGLQGRIVWISEVGSQANMSSNRKSSVSRSRSCTRGVKGFHPRVKR